MTDDVTSPQKVKVVTQISLKLNNSITVRDIRSVLNDPKVTENTEYYQKKNRKHNTVYNLQYTVYTNTRLSVTVLFHLLSTAIFRT